MLIKITDTSVFEDNPWLTQHPVFRGMEDKHIRWLAFYIDPWSPVRFADADKKLRIMQSMCPVELDHTLVRPKDADVFVWEEALVAYADMCPSNEMLLSIASRKQLIKDLRLEESFKLPRQKDIQRMDLDRHKARMDAVHRGILTKAVEQLETLYDKLLYKPVINTDETLGKTKTSSNRFDINTVQFQ